MCGIAGFTRLSGVWDRDAAKRITHALHHRGPDQQGIYEGSEVTLCAVRLKIIDLSGGDQPIISEDGGTAIVFNGEIYNHIEIRRELERLGHRFRSQCDTETVLRAFMRMGHRMLRADARNVRGGAVVGGKQAAGAGARPDGDQAAVLLPLRRRFVLRERTQGDPGARHIPRRLDERALDRFLSVNYVPGDRTLIDGIRKVPPGHLLEWSRGRCRMERWWELPRDGSATVCAGGREGRAGRAAARVGPGAPGLGRAAGSVGLGRSGFVNDSSLRGGTERETAEDVLDFFSRAELRREPVFPRGGGSLRDRSPRIRPEPGVRAGERDSGFRVLLGRAERGRGSAPGLVSVADDAGST
jgi:hypothetical protein